MARLEAPVMNTRRRAPAALASSIAYWISGLSTTGSISFGIALVAGRKRVPSPATGNTALRTGFCIELLDHNHGQNRRSWGRDYCGSHGQTRTDPFRCLAVQQYVAGAVDLGGEIIGAAVIGVELLHQPAVRRP